MGAVTGAIIGGIATVGAGAMGANAAKDAARAGNKSAQAALDEQRAARLQQQANIEAYLSSGKNALASLDRLNAGDYSGFENSPDYVYARDQTQKAVERGASARGGLYSGGTNVDLANALNGVASQNLGNYRNSLMSVAGMGQNAAVGAGNMIQNNANAVSNLLGQIGQNNSNASLNAANSWMNALGGLNNIANQYANQRSPSGDSAIDWGAFAPNQSGFNSGSTSGYQNWLANLGGNMGGGNASGYQGWLNNVGGNLGGGNW